MDLPLRQLYQPLEQRQPRELEITVSILEIPEAPILEVPQDRLYILYFNIISIDYY